MNVTVVSVVTPELEALWGHAHKDVVVKRGGPALLRTLCGSTDENDLLDEVVASKSLWAIDDDEQLIGFGCNAARGRVRTAGGPSNEVALRVVGLESALAYDARRVGGRRTIRVGGGGGGTFMPSNFANSGIAPALCTATA